MNERSRPSFLSGGKRRVRRLLIDVLAVISQIVSPIQNDLQVEVYRRIWFRKRDGEVRQKVAQADRPEADARAILVAADQGIIIAGGQLRRTWALAAATQIDLDQVRLSCQHLPPLGRSAERCRVHRKDEKIPSAAILLVRSRPPAGASESSSHQPAERNRIEMQSRRQQGAPA